MGLELEAVVDSTRFLILRMSKVLFQFGLKNQMSSSSFQGNSINS
jgi:hypothetical protein